MGWNLDYRYKLLGRIIHARDEWLIAFDLTATEVYQRVQKDGQKPKSSRTPVFPEGWKMQFGLPFREHQKSMQVDIFEGYAEAMLLAYNRKCKYPLKWTKLYEKNVGNNEGLDIDTDMDEDEGGDSFEGAAKE